MTYCFRRRYHLAGSKRTAREVERELLVVGLSWMTLAGCGLGV